MKALKNKGVPGVGFFVGTAVTKTDEEYKKYLEKEIIDNNLCDNIFFLGQRSDIPDLLRLADYVFIPSQEGLSLAALEAMAAKVNVVASKNGGAHELLSAANCGVLYENNADSNQIADSIIQSLGEDQTKRLENGYEFCTRQTLDRYRASIFTVFDE